MSAAPAVPPTGRGGAHARFQVTRAGLWGPVYCDSWEAAALLLDRTGRIGFCVAPAASDGRAEIRVRFERRWLGRGDLYDLGAAAPGAPPPFRADLDG